MPEGSTQVDCGTLDGWYYDTQGNIQLCPTTCDTVKNSSDVKVDVLVGCETEIRQRVWMGLPVRRGTAVRAGVLRAGRTSCRLGWVFRGRLCTRASTGRASAP